jgi:hypothetical protein
MSARKRQNQYRTVTKDAIREVADLLIRRDTSTTTLDLKLELRRRGFWAQQRQVSQVMIDLADEGCFTFTSNGIYRTYFAVSTRRAVSRQRNYNCSVGGMGETTYNNLTRSQARYCFVKENWKSYASKHYLDRPEGGGNRFFDPDTCADIPPSKIRRRMYGECRAVVARACGFDLSHQVQ